MAPVGRHRGGEQQATLCVGVGVGVSQESPDTDASWTSTRNWPDDHLMPSVMVSPAPLVTALMTRSLVSRMATAGLTGTDQAAIAARTCPHAYAAAAGPSSSRTRRCRSSVGRAGVAGAIVSIAGPLPDVG